MREINYKFRNGFKFEKIISDIVDNNSNKIKTKELTKEEESRVELELRRLGYI